MSKVVEMVGRRFERLLVVSQGEKQARRAFKWNCICDCGSSTQVNGSNLRNGNTKSCGCLQSEVAQRAGDRTRTHGRSGDSIHDIWDSMIQRCQNPNRKDYKNYGAKGISVCDRWLTGFEYFLQDMGERPEGMTLDRKDVDMGYSPENCRWATTHEQARNRTVNRLMTLDGETKCLQDWANQLGINKVTLQARLRRGWDDAKALTTPVEMRYSHDKNIGRTKERQPNA